MDHLAESTVVALVRGDLVAGDREAAMRHADECASCAELLGAFARGQRSDASTVSTNGDGGADEIPTRGTLVDRYVVLEPLGSGGMGIVVAALDPDLGRKVAIKLIRPGRGGAEARTRLLREAQALAKLSARNIVTVFDVGTWREQVFVAMELVDGETLASWLARTKPDRREILRVFVDAGRGLAAAHAAGLVHRDFKPGNVMIANEPAGPRIVVMDFGLARWQGEVPPQLDETTSAALTSGDPLTRSGAVLGTPAYMSPEQHAGAAADARSDQFSFCVALWQALYRQLPFAGDSLPALATSVTEGRLRPPPAGARVPDRIRRVLARGLAREPEQRFASMDELVATLERDPLRRVALAGLWVAPVAIVASAAIWSTGNTREPPCAAADRSLAEVWTPARADAIRSRFVEIAGDRGAELADGVVTRIDEHAAQYVEAWRDACEATHVRGEQSGTLFDRRMRCLDRKRATLGALVRGWASAGDRVAIDRAATASWDLPRTSECADTEALAAAVPLPEDAALRSRIEQAYTRLDDAFAKQQTGRFREALSLATALADDTADLDHAPLRAEIQLRIGLVRLNLTDATAADAMWAALDAAAIARDDGTAARAAVALLGIEASINRRFEAAETLVHVADAAVRRAGDDPRLRALLLDHEGRLHEAKGELDDARALHEQALALRAAGGTQPEIAASHQSLGRVAYRAGRYEEAEAHWQQALTALEASFGDAHPDVASALNNLGVIRHVRRDEAAARAYYERALAIDVSVFGEDSSDVAEALHNLGILAEERGEHVTALALHERGLAIRRKPGMDPLDLVKSLHNVGVARELVGDREGARATLEEAVTLHERAHGPPRGLATVLVSLASLQDHLGDRAKAKTTIERAIALHQGDTALDPVDLAIARSELATILLDNGSPGTALVVLDEILAVFEASLGDEHPHVAATLTMRGRALAALGRRDEALAALERAVELAEPPECDPVLRARARIALAKVLAPTDAARARTAAEQATLAFATAGPGLWREWDEARAWLDAHS